MTEPLYSDPDSALHRRLEALGAVPVRRLGTRMWTLPGPLAGDGSLPTVSEEEAEAWARRQKLPESDLQEGN